MSKVGIWVDSHILNDKRLSSTDKLMYGLIRSFANKGSCWASNKTMGDLIGLSSSVVSRSVSRLKKLEYITVRIVYKLDSKEVNKRIIKMKNKNINLSLDPYKNYKNSINENIKTEKEK